MTETSNNVTPDTKTETQPSNGPSAGNVYFATRCATGNKVKWTVRGPNGFESSHYNQQGGQTAHLMAWAMNVAYAAGIDAAKVN